MCVFDLSRCNSKSNVHCCGRETFCLTHSHTVTPFDVSGKAAVLKHCGKKEKLLVQTVFPFPTMFSALWKLEITIFVSFNLSSSNAFN